MKLCGLTGGVGMGKSSAAGFFLNLGARIVDTDELAHKLVEPGRPALLEIQQKFGPDIVGDDGRLKREQLAKWVFSDSAARKELEDILHPRIRESWQRQVDTWRTENVRLAIVVIPLLFETNAEAGFDKVICVACSALEQQNRLRSRGWPAEQIHGRIAAQLPVDQKIARSHYVLWTEGALANHRRQVEEIVKKL